MLSGPTLALLLLSHRGVNQVSESNSLLYGVVEFSLPSREVTYDVLQVQRSGRVITWKARDERMGVKA